MSMNSTHTNVRLLGIAYVLETLKPDGIGLQTSYGEKWFADPALTAVLRGPGSAVAHKHLPASESTPHLGARSGARRRRRKRAHGAHSRRRPDPDKIFRNSVVASFQRRSGRDPGSW